MHVPNVPFLFLSLPLQTSSQQQQSLLWKFCKVWAAKPNGSEMSVGLEMFGAFFHQTDGGATDRATEAWDTSPYQHLRDADSFRRILSNVIKYHQNHIYIYIYIYFDSWSARLFAKAVNDSCLSQSCRFWRCSRVCWPLLILDILVDSAPFVWAATFAVRHDLSEMINRSYYTAIYDILWCNVWWSMM